MTLQDNVDIRYMRQALRMARKGLGRTSPNPVVGAIIIRGEKFLSRGYYHRAGGPHAEIEVLNKLQGKASGATMYVTLEPCNHAGRTPPCTEAILGSGIKRVVIGMKDPNPGVKGGGAAFLAEHRIEVKLGVLESECRELNEGFVKYVSTGRPFVMVKSAQTLDGWTATSGGDSKWITNDRSREYVHQLRDQVDAIMVGVGTILADDPQLTCRLKRGKGKDPLRIVVDTHLRTPVNARILTQDSPAGTVLVVGSRVKKSTIRDFEKGKNEVVLCPSKHGRIDLEFLLDILGKRMITRLLVEGGAGIVGSLLRRKLIDKFYIFKAPVLLGGGDGKPMAEGPGSRMMKESVPLRNIRVRRFGDDILVVGYPDYDA
ncbi:MAG: bifunctional diaminohydroxyphosphoribosylaminopyrimidine deaminase/5-amino-6-(5-phosphoribosylamino)uracil reductase RibD [Deltaproteobacteria bacterium]|nr:bifunctional diaminohydroxyphosphoribosylaminopyrimidine deaminase/5-amino-6-(5-phosphoribosylamino)uracil reductase RibD [Deltaproteobacteria bacterium]